MKHILNKAKSCFANNPGTNRHLSQVFDTGFHGDQYLLRLVDGFMAQTMAFIETGTNVGTTTHYVASHYPHLQVYSCEPDKVAFAKAQETTAADTNVHLYNMLSPDFLYQLHEDKPNLRQTLNLYWLDAHDYGYQWPLHDEIRHITGTLPRAIILVDDTRNPAHPDLFRYSSYDGQDCNLDYITNALTPGKTYRLFYPTYTEHTSPHHPLIGTMGIVHGHLPLADAVFNYFEVIEIKK